MKKTIKVLCQIAPKFVVNLAYRKLTSPQVHKLRANELEVLDTAEKATLKFQDFDIQTYKWQGGEKRVLLIHGWEGQAGNFSDVITSLLAKDYTVHAFDGPSHGLSSKGKTSLFEFTELVAMLIRTLDIKLLMSHSFGGVATTYSLKENPDIAISKYVLFTTPDKFLQRIDFVASEVGISEKVKKRLIERMEAETGLVASELNVSDFVTGINVEKALILHDRKDKIIPMEQSQNVDSNWINSELEIVEGTGHFRILRTQEVIDKAIKFLED